ncbi:DUF4258 domain-containing protein [candidate division KSB1 bacterium]|nr:DUF4258 domain-containing protein [candidate division KSB1 bacterium]
MFDRILSRMREKVRRREYIVTLHARLEMRVDHFMIYDVERGILTGTILERQQDRQTGESKYRVNGVTISGNSIELIAKFSPTGKLVIITVYEP